MPWLSFSSRLGVMLPYTPLHMLLLDGTCGGPDVLVMTSGNLPGCPVITDNEEALSCLGKVPTASFSMTGISRTDVTILS